MNLLYVTPRYLPEIGGVENHVEQVSRRLAAAGHAVTVLTADPTRRLPSTEQHGKVTIRRVPAWRGSFDARWAPAIAGVLQEGPWDLVHCQSYHTFVAPLAMIAARRARIPYVLTFHGGGHSAPWRNRIRGWQISSMRSLLTSAARLVAIARFEIDYYRRFANVPADRFVWIPNGCDIVERRLPRPAGRERIIVSVGRLERYKGHHRVIGAMPALLARDPDVRLQIIGSGPYESALRRLAGRLGVADRVEIRSIPLENRRGMADVLGRSSVFALLSEFETHPIAVLEAIAAGRRVVVADNTGLRELAERRLARAVPLDSSPDQIAGAILEELDAPPATPGPRLTTWDECATRLSDLYSEILAARSRDHVLPARAS